MYKKKMYVQPEVAVMDVEVETILAGSGDKEEETTIKEPGGENDAQIEKSVWDD